MTASISKSALETVILTYLLVYGYMTVDGTNYDRSRAIFLKTVLADHRHEGA